MTLLYKNTLEVSSCVQSEIRYGGINCCGAGSPSVFVQYLWRLYDVVLL